MESDQQENIRFADFEGVVDDWGEINQNMAVYRVTLPRGGLRGKWAGRPPPLAPEDLYTGPRSDGLLSTDDVSGEYCCCCFPFACSSITVTPMGADMIETLKHNSVLCFPCGTFDAQPNDIKTRKPGTNVFFHKGPWSSYYDDMDFSEATSCCIPSWSFHPCGDNWGAYLRCSKGRQFHKVETKDIAGTWFSYTCMWVAYLALVKIACTTKKALNEDEYEESGWSFVICPPCPPCPISETLTRRYVNGHPTNAFNRPPDECE